MVRGFALHVPVDGQLELMTAAGIDRMVLSLGNKPPYYSATDTAVAAARGPSGLYFDLHSRYPERFKTFIGLPLPQVDAALVELERGLALRGVVGVGLGCSVLASCCRV